MESGIKKMENAVIMNLHGMLDFQSSVKLADNIKKLITSEPSSHLILNLRDVEYISSAGHGIFINTMNILEKSGLKMVLCNMNNDIRRIFEMVELNDIFIITDSEEEALDILNKTE